MNWKLASLTMLGVTVALMAGEARAQWGSIPMPYSNLNGLAAQNMAFSQMMDARAWNQACQIARTLPPGTVVPVNPNFTAGYRNASDAYIQGMQRNSAATAAAIERHAQALRGNWGFAPAGGGMGYVLPNGHSGYTAMPGGQIVPGWNPYGAPLYPSW